MTGMKCLLGKNGPSPPASFSTRCQTNPILGNQVWSHIQVLLKVFFSYVGQLGHLRVPLVVLPVPLAI
jgi:hypothetical protein